MTKDKALKLALEALHYCEALNRPVHEQKIHAIAAIKEALAQPDAFEQGRQEGMKQERALWELSRLGQEIEAQPEQEPVAWITEWEGQYSSGKILDYIAHTRGGKVEYTPLYTTPPQSTWVGLTEDEMDEAFDESMKVRPKEASNAETRRLFVTAIEAKLKEKNFD